MYQKRADISESTLIWIVGLIQFVNILDFMMVMPLGPDFAKALQIPISDIGLIGGVYTFAAAFSGLIAALFIDQLPRKKVLIFCLIGLVLATLSGAFAWDKASMVGARILAGCFGGPLTAAAIALIADYVLPEKRGMAMGKVAGAFAAASVLGVPFGLELASRISWHAPFVATAGFGLLITILVAVKLPLHAAPSAARTIRQGLGHLLKMLKSKTALMSYLFLGLTTMSGFMIIPNIASHLLMNLDYPRENLGILYFCGGSVSFFGMRFSGKIVDKYSATLASSFFTITLLIAIGNGFVWFPTIMPIVAIFILFMFSMTGRMIAAQTLSSKVPLPHERGAYMAVQTTTMHLFSALGAYLSSLILVEQGGKLLHVPTVGIVAMAIACAAPALIYVVERRIKKAH